MALTSAPVDKYVNVVPVDERLTAWRELDRQATELEHAVKSMGQAAADPNARDLLFKAKRLREKADREFAAILRAIKLDEPTSERRSDRPAGNSEHPH